MDGFFTALICGPETVSPSEYFPYVWGNELSNEGIFQNLEEAEKVLNLAIRHWNTIASTLCKGRVYFPFLLEDENGLAQGTIGQNGFPVNRIRSSGFIRPSKSENEPPKLRWCRTLLRRPSRSTFLVIR